MKRVLSIILAGAFAVMPVLAAAAPSVSINGETKAYAPEAFEENDRIYVPTRAALSDLGFTVTYDEETKAIFATNGETGDFLGFQIDNTTYSFNGKSVTFDSTPLEIGDMSFVPVRIVYELMGHEVSYDEASNTAIIK